MNPSVEAPSKRTSVPLSRETLVVTRKRVGVILLSILIALMGTGAPISGAAASHSEPCLDVVGAEITVSVSEEQVETDDQGRIIRAEADLVLEYQTTAFPVAPLKSTKITSNIQEVPDGVVASVTPHTRLIALNPTQGHYEVRFHLVAAPDEDNDTIEGGVIKILFHATCNLTVEETENLFHYTLPEGTTADAIVASEGTATTGDAGESSPPMSASLPGPGLGVASVAVVGAVILLSRWHSGQR